MKKDTDYSRRGERYKRNHAISYEELYGSAPEIASNAPNLRKVERLPVKPIYPSEFEEQCALVEWARLKGLPLIAVPNGGKRTYWTGQREVAAGLTKGVSDLFLARKIGMLGGYWVEMKRRGGKPTPEQLAWLDRMRDEGYRAEWFDNWELARDSIIEYLCSNG